MILPRCLLLHGMLDVSSLPPPCSPESWLDISHVITPYTLCYCLHHSGHKTTCIYLYLSFWSTIPKRSFRRSNPTEGRALAHVARERPRCLELYFFSHCDQIGFTLHTYDTVGPNSKYCIVPFTALNFFFVADAMVFPALIRVKNLNAQRISHTTILLISWSTLHANIYAVHRSPEAIHVVTS